MSLHVAVLMGGLSAEREVSLRSGAACAKALAELLRAEGASVTGPEPETPDQLRVKGAGAARIGALAGMAGDWRDAVQRWRETASVPSEGGEGYAFGVVRWWNAYRSDPAAHAGGISPRMLAALAAVVGLGLVALLLLS